MPAAIEVSIVGGGVMGCSIAYQLAKRGIKCTVFEQNSFASGASGATAGMITPLWHVDHDNDDLFNLGMIGLNTFPKLALELADAGIDPEFRQCGIIKVAMNSDEAEILRNDLIWQGELGIGVRWLDTAEALDLIPELNPAILGAVLSPTEGHVRGQRLVDSLVRAASQLGATFHEGVEVTALEIEGSRVAGVRIRGQVYHSDHTILAAGPWTGLVGRWLPETVLPIRPVKGQRLLVRQRGFLPSVIVHSFIGTTVPQSDGTILIAATRDEGQFDQDVTVDGIMRITANATTILPLLKDAAFVGAMAGVRPGSPDDVPIIGPVPGWDGISLASGHDGAGIMLSPGTAQLMADYISTGYSDPLKAFSLSRFRG